MTERWYQRLFSRGRDRGGQSGTLANPSIPETHLPPTYSSDQPISSREQDRFDRWPFAQRIGDTLAARTEPASLVIGLYGAWGDGKTSTLRMMEEAIRRHERVVVVRFNPWHFGSEQLLLRGFFSSLAQAVGKKLSTRAEALGELLKRYGSVLSIASVSLPGVELGAGDAAAGLGEAMSAVELDELRSRVEAYLREGGIRVVVLIDDIDRLDRSEVQAIFKLVKLSAGFDYTSYVLAFDDSMVAAALGEKYGDGGAAAGRKFLEKIVQVPLFLPPPNQIELRALAFDGVNAALKSSSADVSPDHVQNFVGSFVAGFEPALRTPRQAKLYGNALAFALPLLRGEANVIDLMLIEGVRVFYPRLYSVIRDNPDLFLRRSEDHKSRERERLRARELFDEALTDSGVLDKERIWVRLIGQLFPRTKDETYGHDWDSIWAKEQRIRSADYFQRFFTYSVPRGDIGDLEVREFLSSLVESDAESRRTDDKLKAYAERRSLPQLVSKLRVLEEEIAPTFARELARAIARNGALIPREEGEFSFGGTWTQAGVLVSHLVRRIARADRFAFFIELLRTAEPLSFAFECHRWMRRAANRPEDEQVVSADEETAVRVAMADRISVVMLGSPLYRDFERDAPYLLWLVADVRGQDESAAAIRRWLERDVSEVDAFLGSYVGYSWEMESGIRHRSDFAREAYNSISKVIDPAEVMQKLTVKYGSELDEPVFHHPEGVADTLIVAHQFSYIHRHVTANTSPESSSGNPSGEESQG